MARAKSVKLGQVWKDSKGRSLEVVGLQDSSGKFKLLNHSTNRTVYKGPRALVELVTKAPPGAQHAAVPAKKTKKKRKGPRKMTPAQLAYFGKGRRAGNPVKLSTQTPSYDLSAIKGGGRFSPGASPFSGMQNPSHYPSDLTRHIAEALSAMDQYAAQSPYQVGRVVARVIAEHNQYSF